MFIVYSCYFIFLFSSETSIKPSIIVNTIFFNKFMSYWCFFIFYQLIIRVYSWWIDVFFPLYWCSIIIGFMIRYLWNCSSRPGRRRCKHSNSPFEFWSSKWRRGFTLQACDSQCAIFVGPPVLALFWRYSENRESVIVFEITVWLKCLSLISFICQPGLARSLSS